MTPMTSPPLPAGHHYARELKAGQRIPTPYGILELTEVKPRYSYRIGSAVPEELRLHLCGFLEVGVAYCLEAGPLDPIEVIEEAGS